MTDRLLRRRTGVNEAVAEAAVPLRAEGTANEPFEVLYRRTFPRVYAYVASLLRDRSAAEEVTAQTYERAYRRRSTYRSRRGSPEAWLFGIARNAALDELRRLKRRAPLEVDLEATPAPDVVLRETVRRALAGLDGRDQELITLKYKAELSNGEIARVLGTSESNVGTRLHRAMEKLRRACDEHD